MNSETRVENLIKYEKLFKDNIIRENYIRLIWPDNWQWYIDLLREREKVIADYKRCSPKALALGGKEKADERSVLPFPKTTSGEYGWLSTKKEFDLEVYGGYYERVKPTIKAPDALSSLYSTSH